MGIAELNRDRTTAHLRAYGNRLRFTWDGAEFYGDTVNMDEQLERFVPTEGYDDSQPQTTVFIVEAAAAAYVKEEREFVFPYGNAGARLYKVRQIPPPDVARGNVVVKYYLVTDDQGPAAETGEGAP